MCYLQHILAHLRIVELYNLWIFLASALHGVSSTWVSFPRCSPRIPSPFMLSLTLSCITHLTLFPSSTSVSWHASPVPLTTALCHFWCSWLRRSPTISLRAGLSRFHSTSRLGICFVSCTVFLLKIQRWMGSSLKVSETCGPKNWIIQTLKRSLLPNRRVKKNKNVERKNKLVQSKVNYYRSEF